MEIKNVIRNISNSKEGKTVVANFGYLSLLQVAGYVFPLITLPYLARTIGVRGIGEVAFASTVMIYFMTITRWSFNYTATKEIALNREDSKKLSEIFSTVFWSKVTLLMFSYSILSALILVIPLFRSSWLVLILTSFMMVGDVIFPTWLFQGLERMKYSTIMSFLIKLLFTLLVFSFVKNEDDYIYQPLFQSIGFLIAGGVSLYIVVIKWKIKLIKIPFPVVLSEIKSGFNVFVYLISHNLYGAFSLLLLGQFHGKSANGIYDAGEKFITIAYQFVELITIAFFPFLSRRTDKHVFFAKITIVAGFLSSFLLFISAPLIIKIFFTDSFSDSIIITRILSISLFFMVISLVYGPNYLIIKNKEQQMRNITLCSSVIGFIISFPLVYFWGTVGAACTVLFTRIVMGLWFWIESKRILSDN